MPLLSWTFAGETVIASGKPYLSTAKWILMPLIFLPPSKPRPKQVGAERQERLSTMTGLGSGVSPQACRQVWIKRLSSRRHSRVQRANSVYSVPNGMSHSWPIALHCMPQKHTWRNRSDVTRELSHVEEQVEDCGCGAVKVW